MPEQLNDIIEFLRVRLFGSREATILAGIVFLQVFLAIVNVVVLLQVVRTIAVMRRAIAEAQFKTNDLHDEILRRLTQDREVFANFGERLEKVGEEKRESKTKVDERRRILKTLVEGFEQTLAQRK
ncbi:MAG: hypothetical protein FJX57_19030 [Alphaproteobacteria bacterium]|nr:hypothetical protein [Alphaproteobacteria bacterium]